MLLCDFVRLLVCIKITKFQGLVSALVWSFGINKTSPWWCPCLFLSAFCTLIKIRHQDLACFQSLWETAIVELQTPWSIYLLGLALLKQSPWTTMWDSVSLCSNYPLPNLCPFLSPVFLSNQSSTSIMSEKSEFDDVLSKTVTECTDVW